MHMFEICSKKAIFFYASYKKKCSSIKRSQITPFISLIQIPTWQLCSQSPLPISISKKIPQKWSPDGFFKFRIPPPPQLRLRFVTLRGMPPLPWAQLWISPSMVPRVPNWVTVGTLYGIYLRLMIWWCWRMINCDCTGTVVIDSWCIKLRSLGNILKYFYY